MTDNGRPARRFRSSDWLNDAYRRDQTALYLERYMNYGITPDELRSGRPVVGIAQSGSDLSPCNRHHLDLAVRVKEGIRDAGGIPMEFPVHPIFENCRRPTAALARNLSYPGLLAAPVGPRPPPAGVPPPPDLRALPPPDRRPRPEPLLPGSRGDALRLPDRRRGLD